MAEPDPWGAEGRHFREEALSFNDYMKLIAALDDESDVNHVGVVNKDGGAGGSVTCEGPCGRQAPPQPQAEQALQPVQTGATMTPQCQRREIRKFLPWQLEELEKLFQESQYPDASTRNQLAKYINESDERVKIWFRNRRVKHRKSVTRMTRSCEKSSDSDN